MFLAKENVIKHDDKDKPTISCKCRVEKFRAYKESQLCYRISKDSKPKIRKTVRKNVQTHFRQHSPTNCRIFFLLLQNCTM